MRNYREISDYFISLSNEGQDLITNLKLQKLMYYAQSWHLAMKGCPLFEDDFQAWIHGPVIPLLYEDYKGFSWKPITRDDLKEGTFDQIKIHLGEETSLFLNDIVNEYFPLTAFDLEQLTHNEQPWRLARKDLKEDEPSTNIIEKEWMQDYYSQFLKKGE